MAWVGRQTFGMGEAHRWLERRLCSHTFLSADEIHGLHGLPINTRTFPADHAILTAGDRTTDSCVLISGTICGSKLTAAGVRQVTNFYIPGDVPDLQTLHLPVMDHDLCTITPATLGFMAHTALQELAHRYRGIGTALWRNALIDSAIFREWVVNLGGRPASARLAHIFCEMFLRLRAVGLARDDGYDLPLSQTELGEAAGLSTVHVNRCLRELRDEGLVAFRRGEVRILDWDRLTTKGDFDPVYLHLRDGPG